MGCHKTSVRMPWGLGGMSWDLWGVAQYLMPWGLGRSSSNPSFEAQEKSTCDQANARKQKTQLADALSDDEAFP